MLNWIFTSNIFEIVTRINYRKALEISIMHNSSLQYTSAADPLVVCRYTIGRFRVGVK
jgi:hypothetical protein